MNKPISVGDLVVMMRTCCLKTGRTPIFTVTEFSNRWSRGCPHCGRVPKADEYPMARVNDTPRGIPVKWLRRIPPLEELEGEKRDEEITA